MTLYFASDRRVDGSDICDGTIRLGIWSVTRNDVTEVFSEAPKHLPGITSSEHDNPSTPFVIPNGATKMILAQTDDNQLSQIFGATLIGDEWIRNNALDLNEQNTRNLGPFVTPDGLTLLYHGGNGPTQESDDLYIATRSNTGTQFANPRLFDPPLNDPKGDSDPWLSPDGCTLYFASQRGTLNDQNLLWVATRPKDD